jgi:cysteine desulfurase/selenocysteine lyase
VSKKIAVIILAAGGSRRMGESKLLKSFCGEPVIHRAVRTACESRADKVYVVTGSDAGAVEQAISDLPADTVFHGAWEEGQGSSVACGVRAATEDASARWDGLILMVADQPFVCREHLDRLMSACENLTDPGREQRILASAEAGKTGNPALFPKEIFKELMALRGDRGARQLFNRYTVIPVEQGEKSLFFDIDTPEAFAEAELIWLLCGRAAKDFPLLCRKKEENPGFIYLDSAATSQTTEAVIQAVSRFEQNSRANVHRGFYPLAEEADEAYEQARAEVADYFGIAAAEAVFTHGATEGLNLAIQGWGARNLKEGDLVLIDTACHHAAIVPWQMLAQRKKLSLRYLSVDSDGLICEKEWKKALALRPKAVTLTCISNVTGLKNDVKRLAAEARQAGAAVIVDCAQAVGHEHIRFTELSADFAVVSAHKMYGPFGIGLLWARAGMQERMEPLMGGGGMIERVTTEGTVYREGPARYEAGTPNITGALGFAAACRYLKGFSQAALKRHTGLLCRRLSEGLKSIDGIHVLGAGKTHHGIVSFQAEGIHPHDMAELLAGQGICVRAGTHCAMPLHQALEIPATLRASIGIYSSEAEVEEMIKAVKKVREQFDRYE